MSKETDINFVTVLAHSCEVHLDGEVVAVKNLHQDLRDRIDRVWAEADRLAAVCQVTVEEALCIIERWRPDHLTEHPEQDFKDALSVCRQLLDQR